MSADLVELLREQVSKNRKALEELKKQLGEHDELLNGERKSQQLSEDNPKSGLRAVGTASTYSEGRPSLQKNKEEP